MSSWEIILPHRLLVNRSLRKASEGLRSRIEDYQLEYDREIERYTAEIEQAKTDKDSDFDNVKLSLINELSKDKAFFDAVQAGLLEYVDLYLRRQCLNKILEIKTLEMQALIEYGYFLTEQMRLIGEEIEILEARKDKLVIQAKVDDVIELIGLSGCDLTVGSNDDAQSLLVKVSKLLDACDDKDSLTKHALLRLRAVLQERVDFLPIIQYISWTIQQKIQLSRQLSSERRKIISNENEKTNELLQVSEDIDSLNCLLEDQARIVREYWAIPITQLNVEISFEDVKLNRIFKEIKVTNERIQEMISEHSSDSCTWERLQREKEDLKKKISPVKKEIKQLEDELWHWYAKEQKIRTLCEQNRVVPISDNTSQESDEWRIINKRLAELHVELKRLDLQNSVLWKNQRLSNSGRKKKKRSYLLKLKVLQKIKLRSVQFLLKFLCSYRVAKNVIRGSFYQSGFQTRRKSAEQSKLYKWLIHRERVPMIICQN